jgi:ketose-bisphosphate aldolase
MLTSNEIIHNAWKVGTVIPAFNIPYVQMMEPIVRALSDTKCFGFITVARLEWVKFGAGGLKPIYDEYQRLKDEPYTRLHLDHVPVIDEDNQLVDYEMIIAEALDIGYESVMIDGSRLPLDENIAATKKVVKMAHIEDVAVEGELGAVLGHEQKVLPPYEEIFDSGKGFTDPEDAHRFVNETGVDWLSIAIGNIHGAISKAKRLEKKVAAMLSIERLDTIRRAANVPFVLHGGSGICKDNVLESFRHGVAKINIGTATRQPWEANTGISISRAQKAVYDATINVIMNELEVGDSAGIVNPEKK